MNVWIDALSRKFADIAHDRGAEIAPPELDSQMADEILELARVSAHTRERRFAPLASFMAGIAVERLRRAGANAAIDEAAFIRTVTQSLEAESAAEVKPSTP